MESQNGAEAYAFNAQVARRRLRWAIILTALFIVFTLVMQWLR